jgi:hypothetical protein
MPFSRSPIAHSEVLELKATPAQVREFITTPERIMDYYPDSIEGGVLESGLAIYCRGKAGISLLEVDEESSNEKLVVVLVSTARKLKPPYTAERIKQAAFFTMIEDWQLEPSSAGTTLTKTWRDIRKYKLRFLPMSRIVRAGARSESKTLVECWNRAAAL